MKVFIAGATGVIGRRVLKQLVAGGHQVVGLSRSPANAAWLSQNGAQAALGSLFDAEALAGLTRGCEAVLHLATAIPTKTRASRNDWLLNDRIRTEGTRALLAAAARNACRLYVQESITYFYGEHGDEWVDEDTPPAAPPGSVLESALEMERLVAQSALPAVVLRFGLFYCHDSAQTRAIFVSARRGQFPIIGDGRAFWSSIQVDDAAAAVVRAVERPERAAGHTFNVVDDEPARYRDVAAFIARSLGARPPLHVPAFVARLLVGGALVDALTTSARVRNQRFKDAVGWAPQYPSYREGYRAEMEKWSDESGTSRGG
jgi:nucleoside-diphosphate-sugar epimerase